jgi:hypothetical protein
VKDGDYVQQILCARTRVMRRFILDRVPEHKRARVKALVEHEWRQRASTRSR